jgi:hypothetical protein
MHGQPNINKHLILNVGFFNILCYHNVMSQDKGYCPGYFKIVHIYGKIRSSLLLAELYNSSVTDADICGNGMCVLYSQIYQDLVLVGTSEFLSQSRFPSLCLAEGVDRRSMKWMLCPAACGCSLHCYTALLRNSILWSWRYRPRSFSSLSYDRSKAFSKTSSPHSAIQSFLFQMRVSSPFLKVIQ